MRKFTKKRLAENRPHIKINGRAFLVSCLFLFLVFYLFLTIQNVSSGGKLALLEGKKDRLTKENKELTLQLVGASSLIELGEKAQELGFVKPNKTVYLSRDETVSLIP